MQGRYKKRFIQWLQKQELSPKELVEILSRCRDEGCETIMTQASCHTIPIHIEDPVVVRSVDLHAYDTFLFGKAGDAI